MYSASSEVTVIERIEVIRVTLTETSRVPFVLAP